MARSFAIALLVASAMAFGGLLGAWAFNPDDGSVLRSEPLWSVFGIAAYAGFAGIFVVPVVWLAASVWRLVSRAGRRHPDGA